MIYFYLHCLLFGKKSVPLTLSKVLSFERKNKCIFFVLYSLIRTFAPNIINNKVLKR